MERALHGAHPGIVVLTRVGAWRGLLLLQCRPAFPQERLRLRRLPFGYVLPDELLRLPAQREAGPPPKRPAAVLVGLRRQEISAQIRPLPPDSELGTFGHQRRWPDPGGSSCFRG
jgi:hypothetical protein